MITAAEFHPHQCNVFVYSSSKGTIRLCDMRSSALCDRHSKCKCLPVGNSSFKPCIQTLECVQRLRVFLSCPPRLGPFVASLVPSVMGHCQEVLLPRDIRVGATVGLLCPESRCIVTGTWAGASRRHFPCDPSQPLGAVLDWQPVSGKSSTLLPSLDSPR